MERNEKNVTVTIIDLPKSICGGCSQSVKMIKIDFNDKYVVEPHFGEYHYCPKCDGRYNFSFLCPFSERKE